MDFYEKVAVVCRMIPWGNVSTYEQIALLCGNPRYARRVGYALGRKLTDVPAHRVINHQGVLSGAMAFPTPDAQRQLLESEGIEVLPTPDGRGWRVNIKEYGWRPSQEELLAIEQAFLKQEKASAV